MRATNTAAGPAATKPAGKRQLKRQMKAHLVKLWQLVGEAGPGGITVEALQLLLSERDAKQISTALSYMRTLDYVNVVGGRAKGARWCTTGVPVGQQPPEWMRAGEMPRQATSVFALAAAPVPADWTLRGRRTPPPAGTKLLDEDDDDDEDGVDIDAAHGKQARPKPGSTAAELAWVAPAGSTVVTTATEPPPYVPPYVPPPFLSCPVPAASAPAPTSAPSSSPHFTLHSDGTFEIHDAADAEGRALIAVLQPATTRALFRWLDRLGGTHLSRAVEAA